jgi:hypothetical protein
MVGVNNSLNSKVMILFLGIFLTLSFLYAAHLITTSTNTTSFNANEDVSFFYNLTVNNTDLTSLTNITEVNITIPSSFSFLANSNGTNRGAHNFTNTSTILSWANDGLVLNKTHQYFWFNATASTPGNYNLTIVTSNASSTHETNLSVTINDTTAPVISLIAPAINFSGITTANNFTFNSTDDSTISNCTLIHNDTIIHSLTNVNNAGGTNGMHNSSFAVASYNWSINCTDSAGNVGNSSTRTFTVEATPDTSADTSPSSSSSGDPTFRPTTQQLNNAYTKKLTEDWKIEFKIENTKHTFKLKDIKDNQIDIEITSELQEATLSIGQIQKFELSGDDYYDLSVKLNSIGDPGTYQKAEFTIQTINESMTSDETPATDSTNVVSNDSSTTTDDVQDKLKSGSKKVWIWAIIVIVILVAVGAGYKVKKK